MCILISSTAHPAYPFILLSNRDEFFGRPTQKATLRDLPDGTKILSPLDLGRKAHGTWIGITTTGKLAALVNYREQTPALSKISRGILPIAYLSATVDDDQWYEHLPRQLAQMSAAAPVEFKDIGGFTLVYGQLGGGAGGKQPPLNVMSNRGDRGKIHSHGGAADRHEHVATKQTFSTSNARYYEPWEKTQLAESLLAEAVHAATAHAHPLDQLVGACFRILSHDTYDAGVRAKHDGFSQAKVAELQRSIFIPPLHVAASLQSESGSTYNRFYGTRTQTVIVLSAAGTLHYYEKNLYADDTDVPAPSEQHFAFQLPGGTGARTRVA